MKKFLLIFGVLFILLFQFTSCLKDNNNEKPVYYFYDEPVVVDQMGTYPFIRNESYSFYVPELANNSTLKEGDLLWSSFTVDLDDEKDYPVVFSTIHYTAKNFHYKTVDSAKVVIPAGAAAFQSYLSDNYSAPIELSVLYKYAIDSLWFFAFKQKDNLNYTYELVLNPEIENGSNNYPTLYIRAKQVSASGESSGKAYSTDGNIFAFDVAAFVKHYGNMVLPANVPTNNKLRFNLKYKNGVDSDGKDIYKAFMSNPIEWNFTGKPD